MGIDRQREELIREELGRIVASDLFCRSDRLCRFLRFSVEQALRGESDRVKEYVVAVEAFDRPASFDSRVDPVVRRGPPLARPPQDLVRARGPQRSHPH